VDFHKNRIWYGGVLLLGRSREGRSSRNKDAIEGIVQHHLEKEVIYPVLGKGVKEKLAPLFNRVELIAVKELKLFVNEF
jgi:hypothetical protein